MTIQVDINGQAQRIGMNSDVKARWVKRLRSGDYPQGTGALQNDKGFCCLGVLCEIAVEDGVIRPATPDSHGDYVYDSRVSFPPASVTEWAGLESQNPDVRGFNQYGRSVNAPIADFNDLYGYDFVALADLIEQQL
ncbi:hypothetical protein AB0M54_47820 [Actinoplanes sp. NPDC051470]|uniref:hypothetical protein n=1 Tax=Actinoplanes sp. NPDC051470 TaxID=3157224 RepID=UPI00344235B0